MAEVCATLGFPQDPYPSTKFQEEALPVDAKFTAQDHIKPTNNELEAWEALIPSRDHESEHDEALGRSSHPKKDKHGHGSGDTRDDDVGKKPTKADPKDSEADPISAIVGRFSNRRIPAFENWRRLRRGVSS